MKSNRKKSLTGNYVIQILLLNIAVFALIYVIFGCFLDKTRHLPGEGFSYREIILCMVFGFLVLGIIDYKLIVRPLWDLEDSIRKYRDIIYPKEMSGGPEEPPDLSIELALNHLIRQQEFSYEKNKIEEKQRKKAELYALQSQIDPHFLYNALDSIRGYALLHDMDEISEITEALSRVFRNMISEKHELLPLRQEMDNIDNYMKIQQFRFNNKFNYTVEVDEELLDKYMVPRMVLQPLVENAIMHGLEQKIGGGWIRVTAYATERRFVINVTDNGAGISEERLEILRRALKLKPAGYGMGEESAHSGIALTNINRRIKLNFGKQYGINLNSTPNIRTTSEVVLPLLLNRG